MEFEGRIQRVLPVRSGTSQRGEWKALPFVFEYFETADQRWSDKVLLETMDTNIMAQIGQYLKKGADDKAVVENGEFVLMYELKCRIGFSHNVRDFDKQDGTKGTSNNIRCYKFEIAGQQTQQPQSALGQAVAPQSQVVYQPQPAEGGQADDLPF